MSLEDTIIYPDVLTLSASSLPLYYNIKFTSVGYGNFWDTCTITKVEMINYIYRD